jgi:hypothetical protein
MSNTPSSPDATTVPALIFAVIAAAIHATCGTNLRIVTISPVQDPDWAREGRRDIFSSHRIR